MDQQLLLAAVLGAAVIGLLAILLVVRRLGRERDEAGRESPIAMSSEGVKLCPSCATENLWTETFCVACHRRLPDAQNRSW